MLDAFLPAAHRERPAYLDPRAELIEGDVRDPDAVARAVEGVSAVSHQAAMVGLGVDIGDIADYVAHNDLGTAVLLRALRGFTGRLVLGSSMVVYGEGRYRCPEHGVVRPGPRAPRGSRRRPLRAAVPGLRARAGSRARARGCAGRPAQRVRGDEARAGAPVPRVRARDGRTGDRAAVSQRLWTADAARHAVCGRREHLPLGVRGRARSARVRGRRPAARLRPCARRGAREPARAGWRASRRLQRLLGRPARRGGDGRARSAARSPARRRRS